MGGKARRACDAMRTDPAKWQGYANPISPLITLSKKPCPKEEAMPRADHACCLFTVTPAGDGGPETIHFEFIDKNLSALERPTRRIFFSLKKDITWEQAEELAVHLNVMVATTGVAEYARGE